MCSSPHFLVTLLLIICCASSSAAQTGGMFFPGRDFAGKPIAPLAPLDRRGAVPRGQIVKTLGGSDESEAAVAAALKWLALHQQPDGSWSFDHRHGPSKVDPGIMEEAYQGATGLGLLCFLGAGQTHKQGAYKRPAEAALAYLVRSLRLKERDGKATGSLTDDGTMYSHGMATIALCEAYGMTKDKELLAPAQAAINYIVFAQDPKGGGWRYAPQQPGDTSVTGWQIQALHAGQLAGLEVSPKTLDLASKFLDAKQSQGGAAYGYTSSIAATNTTAVGLYSRTLLGWNVPDNEALARGMKSLSAQEPEPEKLYQTYFTTQLLRHHLPEEWGVWNKKVRDSLIESQARHGGERGSWFFADGIIGIRQGGRHYCTSLATLILQNYYRSYRPAAMER